VILWLIVPARHALRGAGIEISSGVVILAYMAASVAIGIGAASIIEFPFLRLRDRLYPSRSPSIASSMRG
jgi:hypothetical protein